MSDRLSPTVLSTRAYAAILTWKQADVLVLLDPMDEPLRWVETAQVRSFLGEILAEDIYTGDVRYLSPEPISTLIGLERRGFARRRRHPVTGKIEWSITPAGSRALT